MQGDQSAPFKCEHCDSDIWTPKAWRLHLRDCQDNHGYSSDTASTDTQSEMDTLRSECLVDKDAINTEVDEDDPFEDVIAEEPMTASHDMDPFY